jgi:O-antigen/teichoic acid export membrane protein
MVVFVLGDILNKAIPFLLLPFLTRYLTPDEYGKVSMFMVLVTIFSIFAGLSIHGAVNVQFFKKSMEELGRYIANVLLILLVSTLFLVLISLIAYRFFGDEISRLVDLPWIWIFMALFVASAQFVSMINHTLWIAEKKAVPYIVYQLSQSLSTAILIIGFVAGLSMGWRGQVSALFIVSLLSSIVSLYLLYKRRYIHFGIDPEYIVDALKFGLPLIPHSLAGWIRTGMDKMVISIFFGTTVLGFYSVGFQLGIIMGVITTAFHKVWSPFLMERLSRKLDREQRLRIVKLTYLYFVSLLSFSFLLYIALRAIVPVILDEKYINALEFLPYILLSYTFNGMYFMVVDYIFYVQKTTILASVTFVTSSLYLSILYPMQLLYGPVGVAISVTITSFIVFLATWWYANRVYPMPWLIFSKREESGEKRDF